MSAADQSVKPGKSVAGRSATIPSLDGLRAISIVLVLLGHIYGTRNSPVPRLSAFLGDYAHLGVVVFFVISGFLITKLLLKEKQEFGDISLRLFYIRRALRIFPAAWAFLLVVAVASAAGWVVLHRYDLLMAFTYTINFNAFRSWWVGHLWSLSVEEQFYLLWPLALSRLGSVKGAVLAAVMIIIAPLSRGLMFLFFRYSEIRDTPIFTSVADSLAAGCLLAILQPWLHSQSWYRRLHRPVISILLVAVIVGMNYARGRALIGEVILPSGIALLLAILVDRSVTIPNDLFGRLLNSRPLVTIGVLSYSLYLWQQLFLNRNSSAELASFPVNILAAIGCACLSYYLLERPLLGLRKKFGRHRPAWKTQKADTAA